MSDSRRAQHNIMEARMPGHREDPPRTAPMITAEPTRSASQARPKARMIAGIVAGILILIRPVNRAT